MSSPEQARPVTCDSALNQPFIAVERTHVPIAARTARFSCYKLRLEDVYERLAGPKLRFMEIAQRYSLSADWLAPTGIANEALPKYARYADLAVMGQLDPGLPETYALTHLVERVVLGSGRPTLVLPGAAIFPKRFAHVLLAWNGSREAARAVADALPLVQAAGHVTVLSISAGRQDDLPGVDIADYLRRHCTDVAFARRSGGGTSTIGETILESAKEIGADLLVMGSYGHSRLQELVLGGVTRTVLETLDLPVLMSH
ncbi:universal stress protein [Pandoraea communis]|uniref:universal stress protein n=1 Tax=Pandoraea communis TaxID=2508297 RepID=UPI0025A4F34D|nr:universal stress protein [Pandoraea communis]MDM8358077.1 universal stress protein [Pandoraea communis]